MNEQRPNANGEGGSASTGTSRSLLDGARGRDPAAWERMVALYAPLVLYWCRQSGLRDDDAADVFQDVFHSVAVHLGTFRKDARTRAEFLRFVDIHAGRNGS